MDTQTDMYKSIRPFPLKSGTQKKKEQILTKWCESEFQLADCLTKGTAIHQEVVECT